MIGFVDERGSDSRAGDHFRCWILGNPWDLFLHPELAVNPLRPYCSRDRRVSKKNPNTDAISQPSVEVELPKHILDICIIVFIILATTVIMTSLLLCPATTVIFYPMWTHQVLNGAI
ncbi:small integral membrane protein 3-like [Castor canadensis]|uniref:Small integral membrane protein 3-like n=1 Tax=Castor canadensis TaxID=51338 RepID=A0AC58M9J4_CASCN